MSEAALAVVSGAIVEDDAEHYAEHIRSEYGHFVRRGIEAIEHAIAVGEALLAVREVVPRGEWTAWLQANVPFHWTTAYSYENLAMAKDRVRRMIREGEVRTMSEAFRMLSSKPPMSEERRAKLSGSARASRTREIDDALITSGADWFRKKFATTFGKMPDARARRLAEEWAGEMLTAVLGG